MTGPQNEPPKSETELDPNREAREAFLKQSHDHQRAIFLMVRQVLDDFEEATPWELLYQPPEDDARLFKVVDGLLRLVDTVPVRLAQLFVSLSELTSPEHQPSLEDAEFYLKGIHSLVGTDCSRLRGEMDASRSSGTAISPRSRAYLCELSADLKGKYTSSLMGATAAIVAEGRGSSIDVEPILFPEKDGEFRRNDHLSESLTEILFRLENLSEEVPFADLMERWRTHKRVDLYALADLTALHGAIVQLLKIKTRRALYSGDYRQIRGREQEVRRRLHELEALHSTTWESTGEMPGGELVFQNLNRLVLELAALIDVKLLERLVGKPVVASMRAAALSGTRWQPDPNNPPRFGKQLERVLPLLSQEDFRTFISILATAVGQRASMSRSRKAEADAEYDDVLPEDDGPSVSQETVAVEAVPEHVLEPAVLPTQATPVAAPPLEPAVLPTQENVLPPVVEPAILPQPATLAEPVAAVPTGRQAVAPPLVETPVIAEPPAETAGPKAAMEVPASLAVTGETTVQPVLETEASEPPVFDMDKIGALIRRLRSGENKKYGSLVMVRRLLARQYRVPRAMLQAVEPYVGQVLGELEPFFGEIEARAIVGPAEIKRLRNGCEALNCGRVFEIEIAQIVQHLEQIDRGLDALEAAFGAQAVSRIS